MLARRWNLVSEMHPAALAEIIAGGYWSLTRMDGGRWRIAPWKDSEIEAARNEALMSLHAHTISRAPGRKPGKAPLVQHGDV